MATGALILSPANGLIHIETIESGSEKSGIEILNITGETIKTKSIQFNEDIDLTSFPGGVYFLRIFAKEGFKIHKLILK